MFHLKVIAIDDGVRPQTVEVLKLVEEMKCTLVIALNKVDKIPASDIAAAKQRVLGVLYFSFYLIYIYAET